MSCLHQPYKKRATGDSRTLRICLYNRHTYSVFIAVAFLYSFLVHLKSTLHLRTSSPCASPCKTFMILENAEQKKKVIPFVCVVTKEFIVNSMQLWPYDIKAKRTVYCLIQWRFIIDTSCCWAFYLVRSTLTNNCILKVVCSIWLLR